MSSPTSTHQSPSSSDTLAHPTLPPNFISQANSPAHLESFPTRHTLIPREAIASSEHTDQVLHMNMLHLELLHNYTTATCLTLNNDLVAKDVWRLNVPRLAFSFDFVMYGILALSALHLAHFSTRHDFYLAQAAALHQRGLRLATGVLSNVTPGNCAALYIFNALTCIITLASPRKPDDILLVEETEISEWLLLFRGTASILSSSEQIIRTGPLGPLLLVGGRRNALRAKHAADQTIEAEQLERLQQLITENRTDSLDVHAYSDAILELRRSFNVAYAPEFRGYESADVFIWLFRVSDEYLNYFKERTQESLAIFAFFCVILKRFDSCWYIAGWSTHLLSKVFRLLDQEHRLWIQWPLEEIGLVLY